MNAELFSLIEEYLKRIKSTQIPVDNMGTGLTFSPFYGSAHIVFNRVNGFAVQNGGAYIKEAPTKHTVAGRAEIRMGDYDKGSVSHATFPMPYAHNRKASEVLLSRAINEDIWDSIDDYIGRLNECLGMNDSEKRFLKLSREEPVRYIQKKGSHKSSMNKLQADVEELTRKLKEEGMITASAEFNLVQNQRYFGNTEGSTIYTKDNFWVLSLFLRVVDDENRVLCHSHVFKGRDGGGFPSLENLAETYEKIRGELEEIKAAKIEKNGAYPAIIDHENHGVLWHEVVGHSMEGHRMQDGEWGDDANLFKDRLNDKVAPDFISLYDDPTRTDLFGHYLFDEEGVPGQKVTLIKDGVLKDFLHSRESAGYFGKKSNGHARAQGVEVPVSRMSNLIVKSSNEVSYDELKERLIKECVKQKKPYGLIMSETEGGVTLPEDSFFNTYPVHVSRLYRDGKMERTRGIYIVGTPAQVLENMMVTSDRYKAFDGFCGAESGLVTSTETAPDALLKNVEVNRIPHSSYEILRKDILAE